MKELIKALQNKNRSTKSWDIESESENYHRKEGKGYVVNAECSMEEKNVSAWHIRDSFLLYIENECGSKVDEIWMG